MEASTADASFELLLCCRGDAHKLFSAPSLQRHQNGSKLCNLCLAENNNAFMIQGVLLLVIYRCWPVFIDQRNTHV